MGGTREDSEMGNNRPVKMRCAVQYTHLDDPPDVHFCYHLCRVKKHQESIQREGDILQGRVVLEGHGRVHTHGDDADDGTDSQQRVDPLQGWRPLSCAAANCMTNSVQYRI